jgi:hypothetical protein
MLVAAIAATVWTLRSAPVGDAEQAHFGLMPALWFTAGVALVGVGSWVAAWATDLLSAGRPDGDLVTGLSVLALAVAAPNVVVAWRARRKREGGGRFVELCAGASVALMGPVGVAALLRPVPAPESFLGFPSLALAASAIAVVGLAMSGLRAPTLVVVAAVAGYLGFLWAFVRAVA